jgi:predicted PurR-regulated permease PerM
MNGARPIAFWVTVAVATIAVLYLLNPVLLPFAAGALVAYFLAPLVAWLERWRIPRWAGTALSLLLFLAGIVALLMLAIPALSAQVKAFVSHVPDIIGALQRRFGDWAPVLQSEFGGSIDELKNSAGSVAGNVAGFVVKLMGGVLAGGFFVINTLSLLIIMPIVAFYVLRDWPKIVATVDGWLPRPIAPTVRGLIEDMDHIVAGFIRGVGLVCLTLAIYYAAALSLVGLQFGLAVGIFTGIATFIPIFGSLMTFLLAFLLALGQFADWTPVFFVMLVYGIGQVLEGQVLTPLLVGHRVGLHPLWVIFALMAGGALFGFLGILLAVPAGAAIGVLTRFALKRYRESAYFQGGVSP